MKIMVIYGNPKSGGFVHGSLDVIAKRLQDKGAEVERLVLKDAGIQDCTGCFTCLGTGKCVLDDGMNALCERIREADGLVVGASVRNGRCPALYKRFYERITYPLFFTGDITDKYVLGVSAVGMAGGKRTTRQMVAMAETGARTVDHLFFRVGIPSKKTVDQVKDKLLAAADKLYDTVKHHKRPGLAWQLCRRLDRIIMRKFVFSKDPDHFAHVLEEYRRRGWLS